MPDLWLEGAIRRPGANAGYMNGRTRMEFGVVHYTVGTNSTGIGDRGYFHILFPKFGPPFQFAEIDALTWHAGPFNQYGPGAEWERMPTGEYVRPGLQRAEPLTEDQIFWGGRWFDLCEEWGIPKALYDGPRFEAVSSGWSGQVNHGDLDKDRSDGVTREEWDLMTGDDVLTDGQNEALYTIKEFLVGGNYVPAKDSLAKKIEELHGILTGGDQFPPLEDRIVARLQSFGTGGTGVSLDQVRDAVRVELDATRLAPR